MKKTNKHFIKLGRAMMVLLFLGAIVASCSKNKDNDDFVVSKADFSKEYFNIQNGEFNGRELPSSNSTSLQILNITGNSTILAGGSNFIHVTASENATAVIIGVQGEGGYYTLPLQLESGSNSMEVDLQLLIGQLAKQSFSIAFSATDGRGNFSTYEYLQVGLMEAGTGLLQISLSWDKPNDVDLHLIEPNGEHIYYGNDSSLNGGQLDVDSNAGCDIDNINNENIYYEDSPEVTIENGEYEVLVDLWDHCEVDDETNYIIVVYYDGEIIATTEGSNPHNGVLLPSDESHNSDLRSVMKFTIDGGRASKTMDQSTLQSRPKAFKFKHEKSNKVFKNFGSKKQ